ncbi:MULTISPECIES: aldehyde dehydrogenase family protein [unclassified Pseudomonas]|uniref:aldehyde dehydrogenase family protein n=1 Tax=unclassified Pseudomonas TaxID=196821 RepID=UPI0011A2A60E|nr:MULTISPECIES: aldehyde dehydrogenase family protein [unclassified Pseudomonas]TWC19649.1 aldehyde dehydrogenase (NAD+) [Pseudomonas sp. SJZ075]TWC35451.1 aldehyde dehydrogenase (NAD+) [Pseudomonas sp. SJZ078]TWC56397.1 aldehyde dehydrogenase (NAD+) [Pseudomonas sp. SJZ124]TWC91651.1 aldehyde dehydrogenase (NAD+) [Pseudomonas sp. SJZ101]
MTTQSSNPYSVDPQMCRQFYINGMWSPPVHLVTQEVFNPATEEVIAEVARGSTEDVDRAVAAARTAFADWSATSVETRVSILGKIHELILERKEVLAQALSLEMGAAIGFARSMQVPLAAEHVRVARDVLSTYPFQKVENGTAIQREAIGICALITPWNWPLYQITAKVAPAIAAGCTVVLKPSELSPLSALLFAQLLHDAGLPPGVFNLVNGSGADVGAAMAAHPDIDMISITGSNRAGALVAQAAAPTVKRVTQELGGKSPNVFLPDADFAKAVPPGVMSAFRNVGQSCSAPTRMIVPRNRLAEVEALVTATVDGIIVGDPRSEETQLGPIANEAQFNRVQTMIEAGLNDGAKLLCGGPGRVPGFAKGFYARPTVFSEVDNAMRIAQEEIFGPVLCLIPYDTVEEAIALANDTVYGLSAHVQGQDLETVRAVASRIRAGQVLLNYPAWNPLAPFGGYKRSGNGREFGVHGFEEYMEVKAIVGFG